MGLFLRVRRWRGQRLVARGDYGPKLSLAERQAMLGPEHRPVLRKTAEELGLSLHELLDLPAIKFYIAVGRVQCRGAGVTPPSPITT